MMTLLQDSFLMNRFLDGTKTPLSLELSACEHTQPHIQYSQVMFIDGVVYYSLVLFNKRKYTRNKNVCQWPAFWDIFVEINLNIKKLLINSYPKYSRIKLSIIYNQQIWLLNNLSTLNDFDTNVAKKLVSWKQS